MCIKQINHDTRLAVFLVTIPSVQKKNDIAEFKE